MDSHIPVKIISRHNHLYRINNLKAAVCNKEYHLTGITFFYKIEVINLKAKDNFLISLNHKRR